jgi:hypothetical protein
MLYVGNADGEQMMYLRFERGVTGYDGVEYGGWVYVGSANLSGKQILAWSFELSRNRISLGQAGERQSEFRGEVAIEELG